MEGAPERRRPVRPQAGAGQERRQAGQDRRLQRQPRPADEVAVQVPAARPVRGLGLRQVPERRQARGRDRVRQVAATPSRTTTSRPCTRSTPASPGPGFPSAGAWVTYGLGSENQNLPGLRRAREQPGGEGRAAQLVVPGSCPPPTRGRCSGPRGTRPQPPPAEGRDAPSDQRRQLDLMAKLNGEHLRDHPGEPDLSARIESFELAYRMQARGGRPDRPVEGDRRRRGRCTGSTTRRRGRSGPSA